MFQSPKRINQTVILMGLAVVFAFIAGYFVRYWVDLDNQPFPLLNQVVGLLETKGLKPMPTGTALEYGAVEGLVKSYDDPFTTFVEPAQNELLSNDLAGKFGGIGARVEKDSEGNYRLYPYPDSPAAKAGILENDRLLQVDGLKVDSTTEVDKIDAAIRGPVGETVTLTVAQDNADPRQVTIKREEIALPSVTWNLAADENRVGIIHVSIIAQSTPSEIENAIADLQSRGATFFVLDLRDNGGGLLDSGVDTARLFLKDGVVIYQQYRDQPVESFTVDSPGKYTDLPLVVLVNHNTASAAEILAGSLQQHARAQLVGLPTYGKDTIQLIYDLKDGSSLHVTAAHWWLPGKEGGLEEKGLQPDFTVSSDHADDAEYMSLAFQALGLK